MIAVLIAHGPNSLEVPCRLFPDLETGLNRCKELFQHEPTSTKGLIYSWGWAKKPDDWNVYRLLQNVENPDPKVGYENSPLAKALLEYYYDGCGGIGSFTLKEVAFDSVFVGFDLD